LFGDHFITGIKAIQAFAMGDQLHAVVIHGNCRTDHTEMIGFDRTLLIGHARMNEGEGITWKILNDQVHFRTIDR
jgi:hypothetical protein